MEDPIEARVFESMMPPRGSSSSYVSMSDSESSLSPFWVGGSADPTAAFVSDVKGMPTKRRN